MNLRVVRKKIKSIRNVRKITKAMQMVSAVKMRKAQEREKASRPYQEALTEMIARLSAKIDSSVSELLQVDTSSAEKKLYIIVTSNKGLAGPLNVNVFRHALKSIELKKADLIIIGQKGIQFFGRVENANIIATYSALTPITEVSAIFDLALDSFLTGSYKSVSIIYNQFISSLRSDVVEEILLPFDLLKEKFEKADGESEHLEEYTIEPSPEEIIEELFKSYIEQKIRGALISNEAVEHSARMIAMKNATDNASELIQDLTLLSNRLRQEKITNELLDMITAKESVEGN